LIIDLERFITAEKPLWDEMEQILERVESGGDSALRLDRALRLHYLYQRTSSALARLDGLAAPPEFRRHLEALVARAYGEVHSCRDSSNRFRPVDWFTKTFPQTFRRHIRQFRLAVLATIAGMLFGAAALMLAPDEKASLLPFGHLHGSPQERVEQEEASASKGIEGHRATFSGSLMTHNTRVSILCMASGITWGIGTILLLFYNGVILGAVCLDYLQSSQGVFLAGWLLPHGVVEIPAILIGGQAGLLLATAMTGRESGLPLASRVRLVWGDLATLTGGLAVMLVWAGIVESFFSQYHEPVLPYWVKISFGIAELAILVMFLGLSGRRESGK